MYLAGLGWKYREDWHLIIAFRTTAVEDDLRRIGGSRMFRRSGVAESIRKRVGPIPRLQFVEFGSGSVVGRAAA
jgi:hypothetical protein